MPTLYTIPPKKTIYYAFSIKKPLKMLLIHWTSEFIQAFMAGIIHEVFMKNETENHANIAICEQIHPQLLTTQERKEQVVHLIHLALSRLNIHQKIGGHNE